MRHPKKSRPSSMWVILVFSSDRRRPIGASTAAAWSRMLIACSRVPATSNSQSSAYLIRRQLACPWRLRLARSTVVELGSPGIWAMCSSSTDRATLLSSGDSTPPTQWITGAMVPVRVGLGVGVGAAGVGAAVGGDAVPDGDLLGSDEDVFDEQAEHALAFFGGGGVGLVAQLGEEAVEVVGEFEVELTVGGLGVERLDLAAQTGFAGAQVGHAVTELVDGEQLFGECLDHVRDRLGGLGECELEPFALFDRGVGGAGGVEAFVDLGADQVRVGEQAGDVRPDGMVEVVGADWLVAADPAAFVAVVVRAQAPVVVDLLVGGAGR